MITGLEGRMGKKTTQRGEIIQRVLDAGWEVFGAHLNLEVGGQFLTLSPLHNSRGIKQMQTIRRPLVVCANVQR